MVWLQDGFAQTITDCRNPQEASGTDRNGAITEQVTPQMIRMAQNGGGAHVEFCVARELVRIVVCMA